MRFASCVLFVSLSTLLLGCGDNKAEVKGTVTFDGVRIEDGTIRFENVEQNNAEGGAITNGAYAVKIAPGNMKVSFTSSKVVGKKALYDDPKGPFMEVKEDPLPAKYHFEKTETRMEVKPGLNQKDWNLTSK